MLHLGVHGRNVEEEIQMQDFSEATVAASQPGKGLQMVWIHHFTTVNFQQLETFQTAK